MITTKQRATLRAIANPIDTILQLGKSGIGETFINQVEEALVAREIIKIKVLETSPVTAKEAARELSVATNSEIIQVIGGKFVLYRENPKKADKIDLR